MSAQGKGTSTQQKHAQLPRKHRFRASGMHRGLHFRAAVQRKGTRLCSSTSTGMCGSLTGTRDPNFVGVGRGGALPYVRSARVLFLAASTRAPLGGTRKPAFDAGARWSMLPGATQSTGPPRDSDTPSAQLARRNFQVATADATKTPLHTRAPDLC